MRNIDLLKKEINDYLQQISAEELYILLSVLQDHSEEISFPELKGEFTCDKCIELFGECRAEDIEGED